MKINQNVTFLRNVPDASALTTAKDSGTTQRSASGTPAVAGQAQPSLSPLLPSTNGDFDAARVATIRENISAGRYQVNTANIADGLLATVRELLNSKSS
ncbi:MAG: flagellar biosynthesis anti-sigma factor FlgM [Rhodoferax sp.]|uniref:flagellar biosynthesis anti-sigma factor FlgM n=1 Tax=Rhodoferax sp. TaxID=50421 RepID=UPI003BB660F2